LLIDDIQVHIHLQHVLPTVQKLTHQGRMIFSMLRPFVEMGKLSISILQETHKLESLPRVCALPLQDGLKWFSGYPVPALLDQMLPEPVYKLVGNYEDNGKFTELIEAAQPLSIDELYPAENKMQRIQLIAGQPRNYDEIFAPIRGAYIEKLIIKDPYCGAASNINSLCDFLALIKGIATSLEKVQIQFREMHFQDQNYQSIELARKGVQLLVKDKIDILPAVTITPFKYSKTFHDRVVYLDSTDEDGITVRHIYDLSGGVDKLMDQSTGTLVFCSVVEG